MLPNELNLLAIHETWQINYEKSSQSRISIKRIVPYQLLIKSPSLSARQIIPAIEAWLKRKARRHLVNWLQAISDEMEIKLSKVTVRGQRSRWGSCSQNKSISLNYKLMFLPAPLVDYILTHELCHTHQFNHSKKFWTLVESHEPHYRQKRRELEKSRRYLPQWLDW